MAPFYFGNPDQQLVGVYQESAGAQPPSVGAVLCYPLGREYLFAHRAFRRLAERLASTGVPVLRFDYLGTGDSGGEPEDGHLDRWKQDVQTAMDMLEDGTGVSSVCLIGCRLGGSIAMEVAAAREDVSALVLWDPVVDGPAHLHELLSLHANLTRGLRESPKAEAFREVLGFRLTDKMAGQMERLRLPDSARRAPDRVLIVDSDGKGEGIIAGLQAAGASSCRHVHAPESAIWGEHTEGDRFIVPNQVLSTITDWFGVACR